MSFCANCGTQLPESCSFCTNCGAAVFQPTYQQPAQQAAPQPVQPMGGQFPQAPAYPQPTYQQPAYAPAAGSDSGSIGWAILGFLFPLVGLILYLLWKDKKPLSANKAAIGAIIGFVLNLIFIISGM